MLHIKAILKKSIFIYILYDIVMGRITLLGLLRLKQWLKTGGIKIASITTVNYIGLRELFKAFAATPCSPQKQHDTALIPYPADTNFPGSRYGILMGNGKVKFIVDIAYPWIAVEVFGMEIYKLHGGRLDENAQYTVLDIGGNEGFTALYFASQKWCKNVCSFELIPDTAQRALASIALNKNLSEKIVFNQYGLGNENATITARYLPHRNGISSMKNFFLENYASEELERGKIVNCEIKKASDVFREYIQSNDISNIVLKIDVEGAEYDILGDLAKNYPEIFSKVKLILGEAHPPSAQTTGSEGFQKILEILKPFSYMVSWEKSPDPKNKLLCFELVKQIE